MELSTNLYEVKMIAIVHTFIITFKTWCFNRVNCHCIFNALFSSQTSCTILFISPLIVREICYLMQRRQAHVLSEWVLPTEEKNNGRHIRLLFFLTHPIGGCLKSSNKTSDGQASFSSVSCLRCWPVVKAGPLFCTAWVIVDDFHCCFINVLNGLWICQPLYLACWGLSF